jgi:hypothetical protein
MSFEIAIVFQPMINRAAVHPGSRRRLRNARATGEGFDDFDLLGTGYQIRRMVSRVGLTPSADAVRSYPP